MKKLLRRIFCPFASDLDAWVESEIALMKIRTEREDRRLNAQLAAFRGGRRIVSFDPLKTERLLAEPPSLTTQSKA